MELQDLEKYLEHVDYFFDTVTDRDNNPYTVHFEDGCFAFYKGVGDKELIFTTVDYQNAVDRFNSLGLNTDEFIANMREHIATKAVVLRMRTKELENIVGKDYVDATEIGWQNLAKQIVKMVEDQSKPKLELV